MHLYVYYQVARSSVDPASAVVRAFQQRLAPWTVPALLCRTDEPADRDPTWMEVYPDVDAAFEARLAAVVDDSGLERLLSGPRRVERFVGLD